MLLYFLFQLYLLLLVYKNQIEFHIMILCAITLLNSLISLLEGFLFAFLYMFWEFFKNLDDHVICKQEVLFILFPSVGCFCLSVYFSDKIQGRVE